MGIQPLPSDAIPIEPKTQRWKLSWFSWLQAVSTFPLSYTVASLPASATPGSQAWASDGRKPGETHTNGTGCPVFWDSSGAWFSYLSGTAVAA